MPPKAVEVALVVHLKVVAAERAMKPAGSMRLKALKYAAASVEAVAHLV